MLAAQPGLPAVASSRQESCQFRLSTAAAAPACHAEKAPEPESVSTRGDR